MKQPTSISANRYMDETKKKVSIQDRIIQGMKMADLKFGTYEKIAEKCNLSFSQVWRRLSELEAQHRLYNTGKTGTLSSGRQGIIWGLVCNEKGVQTTLF